MKKMSLLLVVFLAIGVVIAPQVESRGPDERERKDRDRINREAPQMGTIKQSRPPAMAPSIQRKAPSVQSPKPQIQQFSAPKATPQQRSFKPQTVQPQLNINRSGSGTQGRSDRTNVRSRTVPKQEITGSKPTIQKEFSQPNVIQRQRPNVRSAPNLNPHVGQSFKGQPNRRQPTQDQLRQFLKLPQEKAKSNVRRDLGRVGAAAVGGAAGAVALDHYLNRGKHQPGPEVTGHMPGKGHSFNERLTPRSAQMIREYYPRHHPETFNKKWWSGHPNLTRYYWHKNIWPYRPWNYWWRPATWVALSSWIAWNWGPPIFYDFGSNFYYDNNYVYLNGQRICSAADYYDRALQIVIQAPEVTDQVDQWMPLGVFALTQDPAKESDEVLQLAVNKDGVIQGTYYNAANNTSKPIKGVVEKEHQRAIWTFADDSGTTIIMETGIYNLSMDQTGVLVHLGKAQTEQWYLVRLPEPEAAEAE